MIFDFTCLEKSCRKMFKETEELETIPSELLPPTKKDKIRTEKNIHEARERGTNNKREKNKNKTNKTKTSLFSHLIKTIR